MLYLHYLMPSNQKPAISYGFQVNTIHDPDVPNIVSKIDNLHQELWQLLIHQIKKTYNYDYTKN